MRLDEIEVRVRELTKYLRCQVRRNSRKFNVEMLPYSGDDPSRRIPAVSGDSPLEILCRAVFTNDHPAGHPHFTDRGSFRTNDASQPVPWLLKTKDAALDFSESGSHRSLAVVRLALENRAALMLRAGDILRRGDLFGWAALTPRCNVRIATASCLTPCTLLVLDGPGLVRLMDGDHTLGYRLMRQLNDLISGTLTAFAGG